MSRLIWSFVAASLVSVPNVWADKIEFSYNKKGELLSATNLNADVAYLYDSMGNILSVGDGRDSASSLSSIVLLSPVEDTALTEKTAVFQWTPTNSNVFDYYDFYLGTDQLTRYKSGLTSSELTLSLTAMTIPLANDMSWQVVGHYSSGYSVSSQVGHFSLSDSDSDGVVDFQERACMNSNDRDSDDDGLEDGKELALGLDPCSVDTDGDGIPDGIEVAIGSDPLKIDAYDTAGDAGVSAWSQYQELAVNKLKDEGTEIISSDRVLDLRNAEGFLLTGIHPFESQSISMLAWVKFSKSDLAYQTFGTDDDSAHQLYIGVNDEYKLRAGAGNSFVNNVSAGVKAEQWAHLALSYDTDAATFTVYVNGKQVTSKSSVAFYGQSKRALIFGALNYLADQQHFMNAELDDLQVWNRALTVNEVLSYMATPPVAGQSDLAAYYDFTQTLGEWVENVAIGEFDAKLSGPDLLSSAEILTDTDGDGLNDRVELALGTDMNNDDTDGDGLSDGFEAGVSAGRAFSSPLLADSDRDGIPDGNEYRIGSAPQMSDAYEDVNGDGQTNWQQYVADVEANASNSGIEIVTSDRVLDVSSGMEYMQTGIFPEEAQPMTLMYWVKFNNKNQKYQLSGVSDGNRARFYVGLNNDNVIGGGGSWNDAGDGSRVVSGEWAHIAIAYNNVGVSRFDVYVNGKLNNSETYLVFSGKSIYALLIGALNGEDGVAHGQDALLDEVQIWGRALSEEEIQGYMAVPPITGEMDLFAYYDFSHTRGRWVENIATGLFDAKLSDGALLKDADVISDTDGDGINDRKETVLGTDINNADTDGDGLSDGLEMGATIGTRLSNALLADTDGDGIPDGYEYQLGSDLKTVDAAEDVDGDGINNWQQFISDTTSEANDNNINIVNADRVLDVSGISEYLRTGVFPEQGQSMTLMYWAKFNNKTKDYQLSGTDDGLGHRLYVGLKRNELKGGAGVDDDYWRDAGITVGEWAHIALSYNVSSRRFDMYVNGRLNNDETRVDFSEGKSTYAILIGAMSCTNGITDEQDAQFDEVQIWHRALTMEEIRAYMTVPPTAGETDLVAYYDFSRSRGEWVENVATGRFDAKLSDNSILKLADDIPDSDGDGLNDRKELVLGTDINNADSDGDGLSDGFEMGVSTGNRLGDALSTDTDHDGIPDDYEYRNGSNIRGVDATNDLNGNGISNWQQYVIDAASEVNNRDIEIVSAERVLDVSGIPEYLRTGIFPEQGQSMTLMYWAKFNNKTAGYQLSGTDDGQGHRFYVGLTKAELKGGVGSDEDHWRDAGITVGEWAHIAISYSVADRRFAMYVNGELNNDEKYIDFSEGKNPYALVIGAISCTNGVTDVQDAQLDDVQIWARALTQEEIQSYMLEPPLAGESELTAFYNFSRSRGEWVENVATGQFDARLSTLNILAAGAHE